MLRSCRHATEFHRAFRRVMSAATRRLRAAAAPSLCRTTRLYASCGDRVSDLSGVVAATWRSKPAAVGSTRRHAVSRFARWFISPGSMVWGLSERAPWPAAPPAESAAFAGPRGFHLLPSGRAETARLRRFARNDEGTMLWSCRKQLCLRLAFPRALSTATGGRFARNDERRHALILPRIVIAPARVPPCAVSRHRRSPPRNDEGPSLHAAGPRDGFPARSPCVVSRHRR